MHAATYCTEAWNIMLFTDGSMVMCLREGEQEVGTQHQKLKINIVVGSKRNIRKVKDSLLKQLQGLDIGIKCSAGSQHMS